MKKQNIFLTLLFPGFLLVLCFFPDSARAQQDSQTHKKAELIIRLSPQTFSFADIENFELELGCINHTPKTIEPEFYQTQLTINGERSFAWDLTIGNGLRSNDWYELPAGKEVSLTWKMGKSLFPAPGEYELAFSHPDFPAQNFSISITE